MIFGRGGYVVFSLRGYASFAIVIGTCLYGADLEEAMRRLASSRMDFLSRKGIRVPPANRIAKAGPHHHHHPPTALAWGIEYGPCPDAGTLLLSDPLWPSGESEGFRISDEKAGNMGNPPAIIYLVNASADQQNRFRGAVNGYEHMRDLGFSRNPYGS